MKIKTTFIALALFACGPAGDNEGVNTGNAIDFDPSQIVYSTAAPLSAVDTDVVLVGFAGAVDVSEEGTTLEVTRGTDTTSSQTDIGADGSFFITLNGQLDEVLSLRATRDEDEGEEMLTLAALAAITPPGTSSVPFLDADGSSTEPQVTIALGVLSEGAPYLVYNETTGFFARTDETVSFTLPGDTGDRVCVASLGGATTLHCETVP